MPTVNLRRRSYYMSPDTAASSVDETRVTTELQSNAQNVET